MAYEYTTQGYTVNDSGRRLVVDPVTRIEGHLRCEVNINDDNVITNAVSCGTMFRGLEIIVKDRDPRDIWAFVERICGVCTSAIFGSLTSQPMVERRKSHEGTWSQSKITMNSPSVTVIA